jgi:hypothetical protein
VGACARVFFGHYVFAEVRGGAYFPLISYRVTFENGAIPIYETPNAAITGGLGLGVRFP